MVVLLGAGCVPARRFDKFGNHVEMEDDGGVCAGAVGKALYFIEEVLQGVRCRGVVREACCARARAGVEPGACRVLWPCTLGSDEF